MRHIIITYINLSGKQVQPYQLPMRDFRGSVDGWMDGWVDVPYPPRLVPDSAVEYVE